MDQAPDPYPTDWLAVLAESEAELDWGQTVPASIVRRRLADIIARLEAEQRGDDPSKG